MAVTALAVFKGIAAAASLISSLKSILEDHEKLNEKLNEILKDLQEVRDLIVTVTVQILEAIDGIRRQIDEDLALDKITQADVALFNDLVIFNDKQGAMTKSFEAADRLSRETGIAFATAFMYVVNIRLAVLKEFDPNYFCDSQFKQEFQGYINRLNGWIVEMNDLIARSHTVDVGIVEIPNQKGAIVIRFWMASHLHNGVNVQSFAGRENDLSSSTRKALERQANASRSAGIETDRQQFGVVEMEQTAAAWRKPFESDLRVALVSQILNRPTLAIDFNPNGLMIDGRILPVSLDLRAILMELLISREFHNRIRKAWSAFMDRSDDRLVQFAYRRLFDRDATPDEIAQLYGIASNFGYAAFIAALLHSKEYEERYSRGLPSGGQPIIDALDFGTGQAKAKSARS